MKISPKQIELTLAYGFWWQKSLRKIQIHYPVLQRLCEWTALLPRTK